MEFKPPFHSFELGKLLFLQRIKKTDVGIFGFLLQYVKHKRIDHIDNVTRTFVITHYT